MKWAGTGIPGHQQAFIAHLPDDILQGDRGTPHCCAAVRSDSTKYLFVPNYWVLFIYVDTFLLLRSA